MQLELSTLVTSRECDRNVMLTSVSISSSTYRYGVVARCTCKPQASERQSNNGKTFDRHVDLIASANGGHDLRPRLLAHVHNLVNGARVVLVCGRSRRSSGNEEKAAGSVS